jgi:hypothetical protein
MKEAFRHFNFKSNTLRLIELCNSIIEEYQGAGYDLTLRQLYYQLVARDYIPNKVTEYDKLGDAVSNARLAGLIDWDAIVDRTRGLRGTAHKLNPGEAISHAARSYYIDKWADQDYRIEIWVEKEALAGIFARVAGRNDLDYFSCRGYTSQTAMYDAAKRLEGYRDGGQTPVILHFGDHDPSGMDMTRDIRERLEMFLGGDGMEVDRLALNMDQVRRYNPPPNPAKESDSRAGQYVKLYGHSSWELDALDPDVLAGLVDEAIAKFRDADKWEAALAKEKREKDSLRVISNRYEEVVQFVKEEIDE